MTPRRLDPSPEPVATWDRQERLLRSPYDKTSFNLKRPLNAKLEALRRLLEGDFDVDQGKLLNFVIYLADGSPGELKDQYRRFRNAAAGDCRTGFDDVQAHATDASDNLVPLVRYHRPGPRRA